MVHENKTFKVKINVVICDAPARGFVSGVKSHNGYFGCAKCIQEGQWIENRMTFPEVHATLRNDLSFKNRCQSQHHKFDSILESVGIGMVSQLPIDYMHLVCLGVTKRLLQFFLSGRRHVRLTKSQIRIVSEHLKLIKPNIPTEFQRKPRSILELDHWKATELRQFLLYTGPIVFKNVLQRDYYDHFVTLSMAIQILCDKEQCISLNDYARRLL